VRRHPTRGGLLRRHPTRGSLLRRHARGGLLRRHPTRGGLLRWHPTRGGLRTMVLLWWQSGRRWRCGLLHADAAQGLRQARASQRRPRRGLYLVRWHPTMHGLRNLVLLWWRRGDGRLPTHLRLSDHSMHVSTMV
jgi:hypothetical protein